MNTTFLNNDEIAQVEAIMATYGIVGFDACVRLWGRGKTIQVSGDVGKRELACLLAIAHYLNDHGADDHTSGFDALPARSVGLSPAPLLAETSV